MVTVKVRLNPLESFSRPLSGRGLNRGESLERVLCTQAVLLRETCFVVVVVAAAAGVVAVVFFVAYFLSTRPSLSKILLLFHSRRVLITIQLKSTSGT